MNTSISFSRFRHWPAVVGLLTVAGLLSGTALAQRPSIAALQSQITIQQSQITALQANNVPNLASYLAVDTSTPTRPVLRVTAANFQVVNGTGGSGNVNGLGNVIVGYDEPSATVGLPAVCSLGQYTTQPTCTTGGGTWQVEHKEGSHNLVVGPFNRYSRVAGLVAGYANTANGISSIIGGTFNTASGNAASVSGGSANTASGDYASVSGGNSNLAMAQFSSISGGSLNQASGPGSSSVSGGYNNLASGQAASVSGGYGNLASNQYASVSGGASNSAIGAWSSVSGGVGCNTGALTSYLWFVGTLLGGCSGTLHN